MRYRSMARRWLHEVGTIYICNKRTAASLTPDGKDLTDKQYDKLLTAIENENDLVRSRLIERGDIVD